MKKSSYVVSVENVSKFFGRKQVLKQVDLQMEPGKIYGIIGRNGSGKTVLFKCICGFFPITSGKIFIRGKQLGKDIDIPESTGIIIENPGFLKNYSAYRNLSLLYSINHKNNRKYLFDILKTVGLEGEERKKIGKYSLGMRQRLAVAQAIMEGQELLVLDEPMNGLDNQGVQDMRELFLELKKQGKTILLASHNREDIGALCDEVYEMDAGVLTRKDNFGIL